MLKLQLCILVISIFGTLAFNPQSKLSSQTTSHFIERYHIVSQASAQTSETDSEIILQALFSANVVYLAETHDSQADHAAQLEIIKKLYGNNQKIAIALEMFQLPYQSILDQYLQGNLSEAELIEQSEYNNRWGFPWEFYAPILRFAKDHQLPLLALNTPSEITRQVARQGLESLSSEQKQLIPDFSEIRTDNAEYRQLILQVYNKMHSSHGSSDNFENFFLAQVLWDETMAEGIVNFRQTNPEYQIVVLAGKGHIVYHYGIPSRVARRMGDQIPEQKFVQHSVLLSPIPEFEWDSNTPIADFIWPTIKADPL